MASRLTKGLIASGAILTGLIAATFFTSDRITFLTNEENWSRNTPFMADSLAFYLIGPVVLGFGLWRARKKTMVS